MKTILVCNQKGAAGKSMVEYDRSALQRVRPCAWWTWCVRRLGSGRRNRRSESCYVWTNAALKYLIM